MRLLNSGAGGLRRLWSGLKSAAFCKEGGVRALWKLVFAYGLYILWAWAATYLLSLGFGALFAAWNVNAATVARAPGWAQGLFANYGRLISMISSAGAIALSWALARLLAGRRFERLRARDFALGALWGLLAVLAGAGLFLAVDSMRPYARELSFHTDLLWMLAVYYLAALAEERFARGLTMRVATLHAHPAWGYAASALMFLAVTGAYALRPLGIVNMLLTALICARLSAMGKAGAAVGLRFAWSWASSAFIAFPGAATGAQAALRLYAVSENWLTGGDGGLICGAWMTLVLLALAAWLLRKPMRTLWQQMAARRESAKTKKH